MSLPRPEDVGRLLKNYNDLLHQCGASLLASADAEQSQQERWANDVCPTLFAQGTQGFIEFGNLVFAAIPELLEMLPLSLGATSDGVEELNNGDVLQALAEALCEEAHRLQDEMCQAQAQLRQFADIEEAVEGGVPMAALCEANQALVACWGETVQALTQLSQQLTTPEYIDYGFWRAQPANWERIVSIATQLQNGQDDLPLPAGSVTFKAV